MIFSFPKKIIKFVRKIIILLIIITITSILSIYFYNKWKNNKIQTIQHTILQAQTKEGFLVIGKKIINISITKKQNSQGWLKSLLLKHIVSISAPVQVWYGFDLKTQKVNMSYNLKKNCVNIKFPNKAQILTTHIILPITYKTESGIIYKALSEDKQKDLNQALSLLEKNAKQSAIQWLQTQQGKDYIKNSIKEFKMQINEQMHGKVKVCE